jgi:hypothetical protein
MSAVLQSPNLFHSLRRISEQEAIATIGRLSLTSADAAGGIESLASVALRLNGLHGVEIAMHTGQSQPQVFEWHDSKAPAPRGAATGLIVAQAREWGRLRILFEPRIKSVECPLRFARVMGQQVALMLNRLELLARKQAASAAVRRLEERLDTRKAVSRAAGILARLKSVTDEQALLLLMYQARRSRRPLLPLARTVILGEETGHPQPVALRRLAPEDLTATVAG